ncbi:MAG: PatB family C-S lyase [Deltaproteobacteria bacterium]|nr:PatB family C-S lyase [Deltaproteobacteria bacterium]MBW2695574.1 PatB family C-S lyase [Deltaproteobacteria bacterium]
MAHAQLDDLDLEILHSRKSEKWHTYPPDILPAWVAEMDFPLAEPIRRVLQKAVDGWDVGYPIAPRDTGLREVFAARMADRFGWTLDPMRVEILSEVVQGMYVALEAFAGKGEGAVVQTPIYPPFLSAVEETGRRLVENRLVVGDSGWAIDFDELEAGVDADTRVLLFCNPHNPSGRVFTRAELEKLAEVVLRHDLIVIADEIHCDLVFDAREFIPFATLSAEILARTVTLNSPSKSFNIPGLRCAVAHFGGQELHDRFNGRFPRHVRGGLGVLGLYASIAAWQEGQPWLDEVLPYLQANRDHLIEQLAARFPAIRCHAPEGTYLAWLDCSGLELRGSPAMHCMRKGKVALSDGRFFGAGFESYLRLNFATSRAILDQVLDRMAIAFEA